MFRSIALIEQLSEDTKIKTPENFDFCKHIPHVEICGDELRECMKEFPIGFIKNDDVWTMCAILSAGDNKNYYISPKNSWNAHYIPVLIRAWPFHINAETSELSVDSNSILKEGSEAAGYIPLFDLNENLTLKAKGILKPYENTCVITRRLVEQLDCMKLLVPWSIQFEKKQELFTLNGVFKVDERALFELASDKLLSLHKSRALLFAYCQILSTNNLSMVQKGVAKYAEIEEKRESLRAALDGITSVEDEFGF